MNNRRMKKFILAVVALVLVFTSTCVTVLAADKYTTVTLGVTARSQDDIKSFLGAHPTSAAVSYSKNPVTEGSYDAGFLSAQTQNAAVNTLNNIRYIAGLNADVTLNDSYSTSAGAASLVNALNGSVSHQPSRPSQLTGSNYDGLYDQGYTGSSSCNLAGYKASAPTLSETLLKDWLGDSDSTNISTLRHRRWLLSNNMTQTGFGAASASQGKYTETVYSMYILDNGKNNTTNPVAWPAQNTPTSYFNSGDAWNVCYNHTLDANSVKVTLVRASDGKTWNFSSSSADGKFYVDNGNYGRLKGCVIFQPQNLTVTAGDSFTVTVTDSANREQLCYTVNFFDVNGSTSTSTSHIGSSDKYATSLSTADALKKQLGFSRFNTMIVACGTNFADALSGSYLAAKTNAPILLVDTSNMNSSSTKNCINYIKNNLTSGGTVYVLGGTAAISGSFDSALSGLNVKRLAGATRYETNLAILQEAGASSEDLLICSGKNFPDSISASATARPILLAGDSLSDAQKSYLKNSATKKLYIIGGDAAVNTTVESQLKSFGKAMSRLSGATRHETSVLVAETFFGAHCDTVVLATSQDFADGLVAAPLAVAKRAPLVLTTTGNSAASTYLTKVSAMTRVAVGSVEA